MILAQIPLWCAMSRLGIGGGTWLEECTQNYMSVQLSIVQCEELMASEEFLCCPCPRRHAFAPQEPVCGANLCPELCWCVCIDCDLFLKTKCFFSWNVFAGEVGMAGWGQLGLAGWTLLGSRHRLQRASTCWFSFAIIMFLQANALEANQVLRIFLSSLKLWLHYHDSGETDQRKNSPTGSRGWGKQKSSGEFLISWQYSNICIAKP